MLEGELLKLIQNIFSKNICNSDEEFIDFRINGIIYPVETKDIIYMKYQKGNLEVHTINDILVVPYLSLIEVERRLEGVTFVRCNKSTLVNYGFVHYTDFIEEFVERKKGCNVLKTGSVMKKKIRDILQNFFLTKY